MAPKKILIIQHVPSEGLGIIAAPLCFDGFEADFFKAYEGKKLPRKPEGYSALIVLGGPMGVYEEDKYPFIKDELGLIKEALKERLPILGICLGSQLLAKAAGANVYKGKDKEIGWYDVTLTEDGAIDNLFTGLPRDLGVFQWHGDTFDLPSGARVLASSSLFPNQVIRVNGNAYGVQFHLEVTADMIREWIEVNKGELESLKGRVDPKKILKSIPDKITELHRHGQVVIRRFLRMI